jgi:predicted RNA-binding protein with PIN domain
MAEPTLYLFDGYNLLHAGSFRDPRELIDRLASFVALRGARGVVVFDGAGEPLRLGALEVRYAEHADTVLERLAAENRTRREVVLVSSDRTVRGTSGVQVAKMTSAELVGELQVDPPEAYRPSRLEDRLDERTRERLERLRRGDEG